MKKIKVKYSASSTEIYLDAGFAQLKKMADSKSSVLITDENVYKAHSQRFKGWNVIVLKPGEEYKIQSTADAIIDQLIKLEVDRKSIIVGVGGGVITDITGYVASVYMRGIRFGFVPTSILGLVDASIGGKNGIDVGSYKNMVGSIRQPAFILHDLKFLNSLPKKEWENGFAEIIKHACIKDVALFKKLEVHTLKEFQNKQKEISELIQKNVWIKNRIVQQDEFETGERRLLNFGHTLGHALETQYELLHGQAISIGMSFACFISEKVCGFRQTEKIQSVLEKYHLPVAAEFNKQKVFEVLKMDKKRERKSMNFVLLNKIGDAVVRPLSLSQVEKFLSKW